MFQDLYILDISNKNLNFSIELYRTIERKIKMIVFKYYTCTSRPTF